MWHLEEKQTEKVELMRKVRFAFALRELPCRMEFPNHFQNVFPICLQIWLRLQRQMRASYQVLLELQTSTWHQLLSAIISIARFLRAEQEPRWKT